MPRVTKVQLQDQIDELRDENDRLRRALRPNVILAPYNGVVRILEFQPDIDDFDSDGDIDQGDFEICAPGADRIVGSEFVPSAYEYTEVAVVPIRLNRVKIVEVLANDAL